MNEFVNILSEKRVLPSYINLLLIIGSVLGFICSIHLMSLSFNMLGKDVAESILAVTSNPYISLFIGLLVTAILQSSSTTTSLVVAAVASNSISLQHAVPIVMGANIGTTLTSTIVSLSYITKKREFRKAIAAGTAHDIFNIIVVILLFPLELKYQFLSGLSSYLATKVQILSLTSGAGVTGLLDLFNPLSGALLEWFGPILVLVLSVILLFATVKYISKLLYDRLIGAARKNLHNLVFSSSIKSFGWGLLLTSVIQSSSLTTSLIVPLVATGKVQLKKAFQFILGANIGTTITAILAALFKSEAAMSLALAHFLFNFIGVSIFLIIPTFNKIPTYLSDRLGYYTLKNRLIGFVYIVVTFFLLPFSLIHLSNGKQWIVQNEDTVETLDDTLDRQ